MYRFKENQMKLVLITNPYNLKYETDRINLMFKEGLEELHIRKPKCEKEVMKKFISEIDPKFHNRLVLHANYSLVNTFDIKKIHLSHDWIFNFATNLYLNQIILGGKNISKSTTLVTCSSLYKPMVGINELILGPVFSKYSANITNQLIKTEELEKAVRHSKLPVIGLGGVSAQTLDFFENVGFKGVAMQSSIWKSIDPVKAFVEMRDRNNASVGEQLRMAV
jgi:thiamine-phosphate pyrophosphorylase